MNDVINRANLPSVLNGVKMSECDKVIEPFLEERSCDEVWHTVRALRDFYDWVMNEKTVEPCKDAVSREWLLNELEEMNVANFYEANFHSNEMYEDMKRMLRDAPSVSPSHSGEATEMVDDAISRKKALELIEDFYFDSRFLSEYEMGCNSMNNTIRIIIEELPSVTVEPKHGEWKINNNGWAYCPECGSFGLESYSFCPYCGTKLTDKNIFVKGINVPNKTYESKWIPCKEKLPNESGEYLVCPSDKELEAWSELSEVMIIPYDADCEAFGWWTDQYDPITFGYVDSDFNDVDVLAWMPLPTTYKEGV